MATEEFESAIFGFLLRIQRDFEFFELFGNVNELLELIYIFDRTGEKFVIALEETDARAMNQVLAVALIESVGEMALFGAAAAQLVLADFGDAIVIHFVEAADSGGADFQAEAFRRRSRDEIDHFRVGMVSEPIDELHLLFGRNFLREGVRVWFIHK
jgi:hypothetical protein